MENLKRLYRSTKDTKILGVCGGLGEYFSLDSTLIRICFLIVFFFGGTGLLLYILAGIILPKDVEVGIDDSNRNFVRNTKVSITNTTLGLGILLISIGSWIILRNFFYFDFADVFGFLPWKIIFAGSIIALGLYLIYNTSQKKGDFSDPSETNSNFSSESDSENYESESEDFSTSGTLSKGNDKERMILGVCAGIAKHFALDPSIVRIGWAFMTILSGGIGIVLYIVLAILLPEEIKKEKAV